MTKLFLGLTIIFLSAIFALSQTETPATPDWQTFAPENEEFSIEVPVALNGAVSELENVRPPQSEAEKGRRYRNTLNGAYFYIFSDDWKTPVQFTFATNFGFSNQAETTQKSGDLTITRYEFVDAMDFYHTIVGVRGGNRAYVFQTVSPTKANPLVERFFSSIKFNQTSLLENLSNIKTRENKSVKTPKSPESTPATSSLPAPESSKKVPTKTPETKVESQSDGYGTGSGYGTGNGNGNQTAPDNKITPPTPTKVTAGVKILSKPRANYTDLARFYEIQGKVVLRVTFTAKGSIGAITTVSKLPFGLTEQAIAAARGLSFEPATKEGVPYSVTKAVEYSFTIY